MKNYRTNCELNLVIEPAEYVLTLLYLAGFYIKKNKKYYFILLLYYYG